MKQRRTCARAEDPQRALMKISRLQIARALANAAVREAESILAAAKLIADRATAEYQNALNVERNIK